MIDKKRKSLLVYIVETFKYVALILVGILSISILIKINQDKKYYGLNLIRPLLGGLENGSLVRYQGGVKVGYIGKIEKKDDNFVLYLRLKNNFRLPKKGVAIDLATWGFFGSTFINLVFFNPELKGEFYSEGDTIYLSEKVETFSTKNLTTFLRLTEDGEFDDRKILVFRKNIKKTRLKLIKYRNLFLYFVKKELKTFLFKFKKIGENFTLSKYVIISNHDLFFSIEKKLLLIKSSLENFLSSYKEATILRDEELYYYLDIWINEQSNKIKTVLNRVKEYD